MCDATEAFTYFPSKYSCTFCNRSFTLKRNLKRHFLKFHPEAEISPEEPQIHKFFCSVCGKGFKEKKNLNKHRRKFHSGMTSDNATSSPSLVCDIETDYFIKCPVCKEECLSVTDMEHHIEQIHHGMKLSLEETEFDSMEEFENWNKEDIEAETQSSCSDNEVSSCIVTKLSHNQVMSDDMREEKSAVLTEINNLTSLVDDAEHFDQLKIIREGIATIKMK